MTQDELLRHLVAICNRLRLRYFITGSMASMSYGEWRLTNDIDIVIDFRYGDILPFYESFPKDQFYIDRESITEAIRSAPSQFNIIHFTSGLKIDVMVPDMSSYDEARFERVVEDVQQDGTTVRLAAPEDVILKKLVYYEEGASEKHVRDIGSILRTKDMPIDTAYIEKWAERLKVIDAWRKVRDKVAQAELDFGGG
jgi:hypothetical protein